MPRLSRQGRALTTLLRGYFDPKLAPMVRPMLFALPSAALPALASVLKDAPAGSLLTAACDLSGVLGYVGALPQLARIAAAQMGNASYAALASELRMGRVGAEAKLRALLLGTTDPLARLVVASFSRELARPLPIALGAALIEDPSVVVALVGLELLALDRDPRALPLVRALLARERSRRKGELPPLSGPDNDVWTREPELVGGVVAIERALVATLPEPLRAGLDRVYPDPGTEPAAALARVASAAAVILGEQAGVAAVEALLAD